MSPTNRSTTRARLLAYVAPDYSEAERQTMTRRERATFNLDLVDRGWAAPFVIYPSIPGELDLPPLVAAAEAASAEPRGPANRQPMSLVGGSTG